MPRRSTLDMLPLKVREQLEQALLASNFSHYRELTAWLREQGVQVSLDTVHRYGVGFERRVNALRLATEQARAVVAASPDDDNAINDALIRLAQERVFALLLASNADEIDPVLLGRITRLVAEMGRASVLQKKYLGEYREKLARSLAEKAAAADSRGHKSKAETYREIREEVYGLA